MTRMLRGEGGWIPACAGMTEERGGRPPVGAEGGLFAGMTSSFGPLSAT
jgi:hypothetical protein